jgi:hypothetical protein
MDFDQLAALESSGGGALVDQIGLKIAEAHQRISNEMLYQDQTELLVCGFDEELGSQIFASDGIGHCTPYNGFGFHAIGAGGRAAEAWLLANPDFLGSERISEIIYRLCEAKFMAENSPFVGKTVWIRVWFENGVILPIMIPAPPDDTPLQVLRRSWKSRVSQQPPAEALDAIERSLRVYAKLTSTPIYLSRDERNNSETPKS